MLEGRWGDAAALQSRRHAITGVGAAPTWIARPTTRPLPVASVTWDPRFLSTPVVPSWITQVAVPLFPHQGRGGQ